MTDKNFNPKLEIAKAKILFYSDTPEDKDKAIQIFTNIFNNPEIELKYRLESLSFLIGTKIDENEAYNQLVNITLNEELDELKTLTITRKIKELKKEDEYKTWILTNVLGNPSIQSNKRYLIIKSFIETIGIEENILYSLKQLDFFNVVLLLKNNQNYKQKIIQILLEKLNTSEPLEKLIYLNLLYTTGYKIEEILQNLIQQNLNYYFLSIIFSRYYKDKRIYDRINDLLFSSSNLSSIFHIFVQHFLYSLENNTATLATLNLDLKNIFDKVIYSILTRDKKLIDEILEEISQKYQGIYLTIITRYLKSISIIDSEERTDLSDIENEYLSLEDAIAEINLSRTQQNYQQKTITEQSQDYQTTKNIEINVKATETNVTDKEESHVEQQNQKNINREESYIYETLEEIQQNIEEIIQIEILENIKKTAEKDQNNIDQIEENIEKFLSDTQSNDKKSIKKALKKLFEQNKEKFYEIIEKYVFNNKYLQHSPEKVFEIVKIYHEIDETNANITIKNLISVFINNTMFENLTKIIKFFNILQLKSLFQEYIAKNEFIEWDDKKEEILASYIHYIRDNWSAENAGKLCILILENETFSKQLKEKIEKIIENLFD